MPTHTITIEKMVFGGFGLGRLKDGMVVLVRHVLPGEEVRVQPLTPGKHYLEAKLAAVLKSSPDRIESACGLYGQCGGCDLQHATYPAQLRLKESILRETLSRGQTPYETLAPLVAPPLPSPRQYGYRQRIRLHPDGRDRLGFRRHKSHEIVPAATCPLAQRPINTSLGQLHTWPLLPALLKQTTALELLLNPATGKVVAIVHCRRQPRPGERDLVRQLRDGMADLESIVFSVAGHGFFTAAGSHAGPGSLPLLQMTLPALADGAPHLTLTWEAGGFCQVNLEQNTNMIKLVLDLAQAGPNDRVLDLYCGMGNFSLPLAQAAGEVLGLDSQGSAIRSAKRNAAANRRDIASGPESGTSMALNCHFEKVAVEDGIRKLIQAGRRFDIILLDPPRQGAAALIPELAGLGAKRLIYISCNPATLARDLAALSRTGFEVHSLTPIDMFPHTHHLETVTLLERI